MPVTVLRPVSLYGPGPAGAPDPQRDPRRMGGARARADGAGRAPRLALRGRPGGRLPPCRRRTRRRRGHRSGYGRRRRQPRSRGAGGAGRRRRAAGGRGRRRAATMGWRGARRRSGAGGAPPGAGAPPPASRMACGARGGVDARSRGSVVCEPSTSAGPARPRGRRPRAEASSSPSTRARRPCVSSAAASRRRSVRRGTSWS